MMGAYSNYVMVDLINALPRVNSLAFIDFPLNGGFSMCFEIDVRTRKGTAAKKTVIG